MNKIASHPGLKELFDDCSKKAREIIGKHGISIIYKVVYNVTTLDELLNIVCNASGTTLPELQGWQRYQRIVIPRQAFCWFATSWFGYTLKEVADKINRDHTTVITSRDKVFDMIDIKDPQYMEILEKIKEQLITKDNEKAQ